LKEERKEIERLKSLQNAEIKQIEEKNATASLPYY
jgi:hypothetical protein